MDIQKRWFKRITFFVVLSGFEPLQTEPKPVVLPLHHRTLRSLLFAFWNVSLLRGHFLRLCKGSVFFIFRQIFELLFSKVAFLHSIYVFIVQHSFVGVVRCEFARKVSIKGLIYNHSISCFVNKSDSFLTLLKVPK